MSIATVCLFMTWPFSLLAWLWGGAFAKTLEANRLFREGRLAEAVSRYRDALRDAPRQKALHYNLGTALYAQKQYDQAVEELEQAVDPADPRLAAKAHFNLGNCRFRQAEEALRANRPEEYGKLLQQAMESYIRALELNPEDQDAKFNLELARKRYLERPRPPQSRPSNPPTRGKPPQQPSAPQRQPGQPPSKPSADRSSQAPKPAQAAPPARPEPSPPSGQGRKKRAAVLMAPEEARRLLDSLEDEEKNTRKQVLQVPWGGERYVEKDW